MTTDRQTGGRLWVRAKVALVLAVIGIGASVLAPVAFPSGEYTGAWRAILGSALDLAALLTAVSLAVFKPDSARVPRDAPTEGAMAPMTNVTVDFDRTSLTLGGGPAYCPRHVHRPVS